MNRRGIVVFLSLLLTMVGLSLGTDRVQAADNKPLTDILAEASGRITPTAQKAAAARMAAARAAAEKRALESGYVIPQAIPPGPGDQPDYYTVANWANTPPIRKFVDTLPGLGAASANNLGQYIPVAIADTSTFPGSDYYQIAVQDYTEKMNSDLLPTKLRGYRDMAPGADPQDDDPGTSAG